jgi:hypothetical protein
MIIWFSLIARAIYTGRWEWAVVGLLSTGLTCLCVSLSFLMARGTAIPLLAHLETNAAAWSAAIPMQTVPWAAEPWWMKSIRLFLLPFYGLYFLTVFPIKGVLEIVKAIAALGSVLDKWLNRFQEITAAATVVIWVLATVTMFQMQYGIHILDLVSLGLGFLFVGLLIALLLLAGKVYVNVKEFIQAFGSFGLFLIGLMWIHHALPVLAYNLQENMQLRYDHLLANVRHYDFIAVLVILAVFAVLGRMPWVRTFAGPLALGLLFLYTFGTDPSIPFYTKWEWWVGFVGLVVGLLFMWRWKAAPAATHNAPNQIEASNQHPTPAADHGGGSHGGHGSNQVNPWFVVMAVLLTVVVIFSILNWMKPTAQASTMPAPTVFVPSASPSSPTDSGFSLPIPAPSARSLGANKWEVVLPANLEYATGIKVSAGQNVVFSGWTGRVKLDPKEIYISPATGYEPADKVKLTFPEPWVKPDAWSSALLARVIGQDYAEVGGRINGNFVNNSFRAVSDGEVTLSVNCLINERHNANGSFSGIIEVQ